RLRRGVRAGTPPGLSPFHPLSRAPHVQHTQGTVNAHRGADERAAHWLTATETVIAGVWVRGRLVLGQRAQVVVHDFVVLSRMGWLPGWGSDNAADAPKRVPWGISGGSIRVLHRIVL